MKRDTEVTRARDAFLLWAVMVVMILVLVVLA